MKILMVLDHEFPSDVRVENEATALINAGHDVHLACFTRKSRPLQEIFKGIVIHRIPISSFIYKSSVAALIFPFYFNFWEKFLRGIILDNSIDAIHIHDLPLASVGKRLKDQFKLKLVVDLHENWPALLSVSKHTNTLLGKILSPITAWKKYEKRVLQYADNIIVVVDEAKERLIELGIDRSKVSIVSNTLNESEFGFPDVKPNPDYFTLYYAGGITFHRGLQTAIEAVSKVKDKVKNIRLKIAGSGSYQPELERLVKRLNIEKYVEFLGYLTLKEVAINLAKADAALIPHLKTDHTDSTIPHKLFQYMYINKPIIASNCAPIERIVNETSSGVIFKSGCVDDLANKILLLVSDKTLISPARKWVEQKYKWDMDAKVLVNSYENLN